MFSSIRILHSKVICVFLIVLIETSSLSRAFSSPPAQQEWEIKQEGDTNPDIFSLWPKPSLDELKSSLKSPIESVIKKYLPGTTKPIDYTIKITAILESEIEEEELKAPGSLSILTKCIQATNEIVLHVDTNYVFILEDSVKIFEATPGKPLINRPIPIVNQTYDVSNEFYVIHLGVPCKVHREYIIEIRFVAEIATDTLTGLYLCTYTDPITNLPKRLATTQFEAEHARQMFPHYDDPDHKATFRLIIGRNGNYHSKSNMNLIKTEENKDRPGWYWDHYAPTPIMSSYLIAIVVSDFTCVSAPPQGYKKPVEVCGPPHMIEKGGGLHSAEAVATILRFYDDFMKQEYPLPKMTSVAIPDFQAQRVQWRTGFATYIYYFGLKSVSPEYDPDKQWLTGYRRRAFQIDGSANTHPLVNVSSPMYFFDGISYSKGASLLKMLENFLTPRVFHEALRLYLAKHAYGTATQWDLFDVLERHAVTSGVRPSVASITEIMESWTLQPGFPLIRVNYMFSGAILLTQERFIDTPQTSVLPPNKNWFVPIRLFHKGSQLSLFDKKVPNIWLTNKEKSKIVYVEKDITWVVVNPEASGNSAYARVLYDDKTSKLIEDQLNIAHEVISPLTRAQLIEDAFELAWAGYGPVEAALNFTRYLGKEVEPIVWTSALDGLGKIYSMFAADEVVISRFKEYVFERIASTLATIGIEQSEGEKGISVLHRGSLLRWAGILEIPEVLEKAISKVHSWVESSINSVPSDLHSQTYCNAIIGGEKNIYDALLNLLHKENDVNIQEAVARSLGCSKSELILNDLKQNLTKQEFEISPALGYQLMLRLSRNSVSRKNLIEYFDENFNAIQNRFDGVFIIAKGLETAAQYWNTQQQLEQVKLNEIFICILLSRKFIVKRLEFKTCLGQLVFCYFFSVQAFIEKYSADLEDVDRILKRTLQQIKNNISWMERLSDSVKEWIKRN